MLEDVHKHFFFPLLHAAGDLRDIMGVFFNSTAQADRVDPDDTYADDPSAMLVSVSRCLLKAECVMSFGVSLHGVLEVQIHTQARGRCMERQTRFHSIHVRVVSTCVPSCQISDARRTAVRKRQNSK